MSLLSIDLTENFWALRLPLKYSSPHHFHAKSGKGHLKTHRLHPSSWWLMEITQHSPRLATWPLCWASSTPPIENFQPISSPSRTRNSSRLSFTPTGFSYLTLKDDESMRATSLDSFEGSTGSKTSKRGCWWCSIEAFAVSMSTNERFSSSASMR